MIFIMDSTSNKRGRVRNIDENRDIENITRADFKKMILSGCNKMTFVHLFACLRLNSFYRDGKVKDFYQLTVPISS